MIGKGCGIKVAEFAGYAAWGGPVGVAVSAGGSMRPRCATMVAGKLARYEANEGILSKMAKRRFPFLIR